MPAIKSDLPEGNEQENKEELPAVAMKAEVIEDDEFDGAVKPKLMPSSVNPPGEEGEVSPVGTDEAQPIETTGEETELGTEPQASQVEEGPEEPIVNQLEGSLMDSPQEVKKMAGEAESSAGMPSGGVSVEGKGRKLFGVGIVILVLVIVAIGFVLYRRGMLPWGSVGKEPAEVQPSAVVATPTPSPSPEVVALKREEITVDVLNGSGVTGAAGKLANKLKELGYEIGEVGNADATDENELYVLEEMEDQLATLYKDLKDELGIRKVAGYLDEDSEVTARVILGGGETTKEEAATDAEAGTETEESTESGTTAQ